MNEIHNTAFSQQQAEYSQHLQELQRERDKKIEQTDREVQFNQMLTSLRR